MPSNASFALPDDQAAFAALVVRHRAELQLHCYRFMGSLQDAEDLVQETLLRAWTKRDTFQGRSTVRAWLYGIATHACLDALRRRARRLTPPEVVGPADPEAHPEPPTDLPWLEPYPDRLLEDVVTGGISPEAKFLSRETTELAFLAAIQHLPPRQRAVLILRDVLEWSAKETAEALDTTVASVNSALQRARQTLQQRRNHPGSGTVTTRSHLTAAERSLAARMADAWERADAAAVAALISENARLVMPPVMSWYDGREAITTFLGQHAFGLDIPDHFRAVATAANRQPALGLYARDETGRYRATALLVLTITADAVTEMALFHLPRLFPPCGLPTTL